MIGQNNMKTLGLIGGISWFSTSIYYKTINQLTNERLGAAHSAKLFLYSVDFNDFKTLQEKDDWKQIESMLCDSAMRLENAGADCILICSNTPHLVADAVRQKIKIPFIHIAEETAKEIARQKINKGRTSRNKIHYGKFFFQRSLVKWPALSRSFRTAQTGILFTPPFWAN